MPGDVSRESSWFVAWIGVDFSWAGTCEAIPKESGDGACHEKEHRAGKEEPVGDPLAVEQSGGLRIQRSEEAFDAAN